MTKVMKKASALLLSVAMAVTMLPAFALTSFAAMGDSSTPAIQVEINGVSLGKKTGRIILSGDDFKAGPQIFSYLQKKSKVDEKEAASLKYMVAEGYDLDKALGKVLTNNGIDPSVLDEATLEWTCSDGFVTSGLEYSKIMAATKVAKLGDVDETGNRYVEELTGEDVKDVTPIIATSRVNVNANDDEFDTYEKAKAFAEKWDSLTPKEKEKVTSEVGMVIGNNFSVDKDQRLVEQNGNHNDKSINWNSKFYGKNSVIVNIVLPVKVNMNDVTFTTDSAVTVAPFDMDTEAVKAVYGEVKWDSSDVKVATVEAGKITPVAPGTCKVSFTTARGKTSGKLNVTVSKAAFTPAKVSLNSAKNVKKKAISVKWKKASKADFYQVSIATKKKSTKVVSKNNTSTSYKMKKLKKGKKYYVKVRAARTVNGATYYGAWSTVKTVKVKK